MEDEVCPICGRQRTWSLWRKCECGYDFGPETPPAIPKEAQSNGVPSIGEKIPSPRVIVIRSVVATVFVSLAIWGIITDGPFASLFLWIAFWFRRDSIKYSQGQPRWIRHAVASVGVVLLSTVLTILVDPRLFEIRRDGSLIHTQDPDVSTIGYISLASLAVLYLIDLVRSVLIGMGRIRLPDESAKSAVSPYPRIELCNRIVTFWGGIFGSAIALAIIAVFPSMLLVATGLMVVSGWLAVMASPSLRRFEAPKLTWWKEALHPVFVIAWLFSTGVALFVLAARHFGEAKRFDGWGYFEVIAALALGIGPAILFLQHWRELRRPAAVVGAGKSSEVHQSAWSGVLWGRSTPDVYSRAQLIRRFAVSIVLTALWLVIAVAGLSAPVIDLRRHFLLWLCPLMLVQFSLMVSYPNLSAYKAGRPRWWRWALIITLLVILYSIVAAVFGSLGHYDSIGPAMDYRKLCLLVVAALIFILLRGYEMLMVLTGRISTGNLDRKEPSLGSAK